MCWLASFSHRRVAPAVIFSNRRANGHTFARFTILFAYKHIHIEVRCTALNTAWQKHDLMTQTERKGLPTQVNAQIQPFICLPRTPATHTTLKRPIERGPLLPSSRGLLWLTVSDGGHIFSSKGPALFLAPAMYLILLFTQSKLVKTQLMQSWCIC